MSKSLLICDLDGTLVDSFPGVAEALRVACVTIGIQPAIRISPAIVGPQLDTMLEAVTGPTRVEMRTQFRKAFIEAYDGGTCVLSNPFDGVEEMLWSIWNSGHTIALATNKRLIPTHEIVNALGWRKLFCSIDTPDTRPGRVRTKAEMLKDIRRAHGRLHCATFYLGDTDADVRAALDAGVTCILATWGYGMAFAASGPVKASTPAEVCSILSPKSDP